MKNEAEIDVNNNHIKKSFNLKIDLSKIKPKKSNTKTSNLVFDGDSDKQGKANKKEIIKGIHEGAIDSTTKSNKKKANLVIPLARPFQDSAKEVELDESLDESDRVARDAILDDLAGNNSNASNKDKLQIDLGVNDKDDDDGVGVLKKNRLPGISEDMNPSEKFKLDLSYRPTAVEATSGVYDDTPFEEFGFAMLRGMGYDESIHTDDVEVKLKRRPTGLGLGASDAAVIGREKKMKIGDKRKTKRSRLEDGDKVGIMSGVYKGHIALLLQTRNVPGLEKAMLRLDNWPNGCEIKMDKKLCYLILTLEDYKEFSYTFSKSNPSPPIPEPKNDESKTKLSRKNKVKECVDDNNKSKKRIRSSNEDRNNDSNSNHQDSTDRKKRRYESTVTSHSESWLMTSIRVRIVRERWEDIHLKKAIIIDVPKIGSADVILPSGERVDNVKEKYLQTALPKSGGEVLVLRGEYRGGRGKLLERNSRTGQAVVQLYEDSIINTLSMEDVAEYCG